MDKQDIDKGTITRLTRIAKVRNVYLDGVKFTLSQFRYVRITIDGITATYEELKVNMQAELYHRRHIVEGIDAKSLAVSNQAKVCD